jgi:hypothetical protein
MTSKQREKMRIDGEKRCAMLAADLIIEMGPADALAILLITASRLAETIGMVRGTAAITSQILRTALSPDRDEEGPP